MTSRPLPADIVRRIERDFGVAAGSVRNDLEALDTLRERDRVIRAVLYLAAGDPRRLAHDIAVARADHRDVLWWAEYDADRPTVRVRDFRVPFSDEA